MPSGAFVARRNGRIFVTGNSGFPKSHDISKAIDKAAYAMPLWDSIREHIRYWRDIRGWNNRQLNEAIGSENNGCGMARHWTSEVGGQHSIPSKEQWRSLKAALAWPDCELDAIYDEVKDGAARPVVSQQRQGRLAVAPGQGMDRSAVMLDITAPATDAAKQWAGWGTALKPAVEIIILARKPLSEPTIAANVLRWGTGGLAIDKCRIGIDADDDALRVRNNTRTIGGNGKYGGGAAVGTSSNPQGRWPANLVLDEDAAALLDAQSGVTGGGKRVVVQRKRNKGWVNSSPGDGVVAIDNYGDSGGASRFFYTAKASKRDRDEGLEGMPEQRVSIGDDRPSGTSWERRAPEKNPNYPRANHHPTVKPTALMQWLVRLVTPPGGTVLDPFMGSGSTGKAAMLEGFSFIGIDIDEEYLAIADKRIAHAIAQYVKQQEMAALQPRLWETP